MLECENCDAFLERAFSIFELLVAVRDNFDGSDYQQGKKDGLRLALSLLEPGKNWANFNLGGASESGRKLKGD